MRIILREDVEKLGRRGEVVKVAPGYGRNYLLPKGLAYLHTAGNEKRVEQERRFLNVKARQGETGRRGNLARRISQLSLTIVRKGRRERDALRVRDETGTSARRSRRKASESTRERSFSRSPSRRSHLHGGREAARGCECRAESLGRQRVEVSPCLRRIGCKRRPHRDRLRSRVADVQGRAPLPREEGQVDHLLRRRPR